MFFNLLAAAVVQVALPIDIKPVESGLVALSGSSRSIQVAVHNSGDTAFDGTLSTHVVQVATSVTVPITGPRPWKTVSVAPGQTIIESITETFPEVKARTRFDVVWLDDQNNTLGRVSVMVYPADVFERFNEFASAESPIGLWQVPDQPRQWFVNADIEAMQLSDSRRLNQFKGQLVVVWPSSMSERLTSEFENALHARILNGMRVVELIDREDVRSDLAPFIQRNEIGRGVLVRAPLSWLNEDPEIAQLRLVWLAELAMRVDRGFE